MKPALLLITGSLLLATTAVAQPDPGDADADGAPLPVAADPPDVRQPPPPPPAPAPSPRPAPTPLRPTAYSVGLGLGYNIPAELNAPTVSSARFRLASGLTFEPGLSLSSQTTSRDDGSSTVDDAVTDVELVMGVRAPFRSHGRVDFSLLGQVGFGLITENPDGSHNDQTTSVLSLSYGIGLDYWINQHWNLSFSTANPLLTRASLTSQNGPGSPDDKRTSSRL